MPMNGCQHGVKGDTFKTDPPNAVLTWMDGDDVKEAEIIITDATVENYGRDDCL